MCIISNSSFKIKAESKAHVAHKRDLTRLFDEFFTVLLTAKIEITIKNNGMTMKINGITIKSMEY